MVTHGELKEEEKITNAHTHTHTTKIATVYIRHHSARLDCTNKNESYDFFMKIIFTVFFFCPLSLSFASLRFLFVFFARLFGIKPSDS